jgi:cytochrome c oxidase cbb3-type subunit 3
MVGVILLECLVMLVLALQLKSMLARERSKTATAETGEAAVAAKPRLNWWNRMNRLKPVEQEASLDLGHDYDGIRELDNRLPPWWLWGFYITIVFAVVYFWRFHVSHTAPLSAEEYQIAVKKAEADQREYLKHAANLVDENTVKLLTDAADINAGKSIFQQNCTPCHGGAGEGNTVGPNLTDDYWLHGGSIHDVFRSIKYGWQEKGMKSWKDDFTPSQIAQIASFVKSLHGSNPPNPKPPQGELYKEAAASDSSGTAVNAASN